jgi:hypothetical protein
MAGSGERDGHRLIERVRRAGLRDVGDQAHDADDDDGGTGDDRVDAPDDTDLSAVNRLMGFLRRDDDGAT